MVAGSVLYLPNVAAQDEVLTFYSHGSMATTGLPGAKHGIFYGRIYDGNQFLLSFRDGVFVKNNRFVVMSLAPGLHTFSASYSSHPAKNSKFTIMLESGKNYFLRAQSESSGIFVLEFEKGRFDQVSCEVAHQDTENAKPLEKNVASSLAGRVVPGQLIPSCP